MCVSSGITFVSTLKHNHCRNIFPCDEHSCASLEEVSRELYNHNCCTDIISVLDSCVSSGKFLRELCSHTRCTNIIPVESSCDSAKEPLCKFFKCNDYSDIFPVRQSCDSAKSPFLWNPKVQFSHSKLCLNLNRELQQLGWTQWAPEPPTTYQIASENECSNPSISPHQITAWNYTKCSLKSSFHWKIWHTWPPPRCKTDTYFCPSHPYSITWNRKRFCTNSNASSPCVAPTIFCWHSQNHTQNKL